MPEMSEQVQIAEVERRLAGRYTLVPPDEVSAVVRDAHKLFHQSRIRDFVPLLVERRTREDLAHWRLPVTVSMPETRAALRP